MSRLPVLSPLPKSVPSRRSAPASMASSAEATAVPRSLWGWTDRTMASRLVKLASEPLDNVGEHVGCVHFHCGWQIEDEGSLGAGFDDVATA